MTSASNETNNLPDIRSVLPHSGPMVLLDRVLAVSAEELCAEVCIGAHSLFFDGTGVGAWVGIEYMAQAIAAWDGYHTRQRNESVKIGFLLGSRRYESHCASFPVGSVLQVQIRRVLQGENGLAAFDCKIVDGAAATLANATITVFQPEDANQFLQEINKKGSNQ